MVTLFGIQHFIKCYRRSTNESQSVAQELINEQVPSTTPGQLVEKTSSRRKMSVAEDKRFDDDTNTDTEIQNVLLDDSTLPTVDNDLTQEDALAISEAEQHIQQPCIIEASQSTNDVKGRTKKKKTKQKRSNNQSNPIANDESSADNRNCGPTDRIAWNLPADDGYSIQGIFIGQVDIDFGQGQIRRVDGFLMCSDGEEHCSLNEDTNEFWKGKMEQICFGDGCLVVGDQAFKVARNAFRLDKDMQWCVKIEGEFVGIGTI